MDEVAIRVQHVSKKYTKSLRKSMAYGIADIGRNSLGLSSHSERLRGDEFWALDDVSFEVKKGETLGIIGPNGSGKTTLLKLINGIFWPDVGKITIAGKVGALIAVGAGFHPLLTGRENIHVNGAILGMNKHEIRNKFDAIVDFADIGDFLDVPVKHYSSGMFVRLGFAVAAHCEPDILLVDEVLAVGDIDFQLKCMKKMNEVRQKNVAVILVSHHMPKIGSFCDKALLLKTGRKIVEGHPSEVIDEYERKTVHKENWSRIDNVAGSNPVGGAELYDVNYETALPQDDTLLLDYGRPIIVTFGYDLHEYPIDDVCFSLLVYRKHDGCRCFSVTSHHYRYYPKQSRGCVRLVIEKHKLLPNMYVMDVQIRSIKYDVPLATYREKAVQVRHVDEYLHSLLSGVYQPDGVSWDRLEGRLWITN